MNAEVQKTFDFQRLWIPRMRELIGARLLREGTLDEDQKEATDLIVFTLNRSLRIACRLRRPGYSEKYGNQVTITCRRESGAQCEWDKMILGGWSDWFFYGHAQSDQPMPDCDIRPWYLIDLRWVRTWMRNNCGTELGPNQDSPGKRCWFYAFEIERMKRECGTASILASG